MAAAALAIAVLATPAVSATLTLSSIDGVWNDPTPASAVTGVGTSRIDWGRRDPRGFNRKSAYVFSPESPVTLDSQDKAFRIGTFTHRNYKVKGAALRTTNLSVATYIAGVAAPITTVFSFAHLETPNLDREERRPASKRSICANGGRNFKAHTKNRNGCADRVTAVVNPSLSDTFEIDGITYILDIIGFQVKGKTFKNFWTVENKINRAYLVAKFRVVDTPPPPPPPPVPLPAAAWLLAGAVGSLAAARRLARRT